MSDPAASKPALPLTVWQQHHAADFAAIHDALHSLTTLDLSGTTHTDWLTTVRTIRDRVQTFSIVIPNADKLISLLTVAEKQLLAVAALKNLAKDA